MLTTFLLRCFALLTLSSWEAADGMTKLYGNREWNDKLLYEDRVTKAARFILPRAEERDYTTGGKITFINATELSGGDGYAVIQEGGVDYKDVKLAYFSFRGYDFEVHIYGFDEVRYV